MICRYIANILFVILFCVCSNAETVTQRQAQKVAIQFFSRVYEGQENVESNIKLVYSPRQLTTDRLFIPFYIYNYSSRGFVVVPADNKAFPILGYSMTESFDPKNIPSSTLSILKLYARHIELVRYDATLPIEAIESWNNIPQYVNDVLTAKYIADDPRMSDIELREKIPGNDLEDLYFNELISDRYSPTQWMQFVDTDLRENIQPIILIGGTPFLVHGFRNGFYRLFSDKINRNFWRLMPTESVNTGEILISPSLHDEKIRGEYVAEEPFTYSDSYYPKIMEESIHPSIIDNDNNVFLTRQGAGHYTFMAPVNIQKIDIYSPDGTHKKLIKYRDSPIAICDLSSQPQGIYIALVTLSDNSTYSYKLIR